MTSVLKLVQVGFNEREAEHLGYLGIADAESDGNSSQADAYPLIGEHTIFSVVGATTNSARLPSFDEANGSTFVVVNEGLNDLKVYPQVGGRIDRESSNNPVTIPPLRSRIFFQVTETQWVSFLQYNSEALIDNAAWVGWTPTLGASGSMTFTSTTINTAKYKKIGTTIFYQLDISGTIGGTLSTDITVTVPSGEDIVGSGFTIGNGNGGGGTKEPVVVKVSSATTMKILLSDESNQAAGSFTATVNGFYETDPVTVSDSGQLIGILGITKP